MIRSAPVRVPPVALAISATTCVQLGAAVSVSLFAGFGVIGTVWLRQAIAALLLLVAVRPRGMNRAQWVSAAALGAVMTANSVLFAASADRIPLGVTVAIEFCGPLTMAALGAGGVRRLVWPLIALLGVVVLTRPWTIATGTEGRTWLGIVLAAGAAVGWAAYILLSAKVGSHAPGFAGLSIALCVPALVLAPFAAAGVLDAAQHHPWTSFAWCGLAAVLSPLSAFMLELVALRRMPASVFGMWMALEPAVGALVGLLVLGQPLSAWQLPGFALVVLAGVATSTSRDSSSQKERGPSEEVRRRDPQDVVDSASAPAVRPTQSSHSAPATG